MFAEDNLAQDVSGSVRVYGVWVQPGVPRKLIKQKELTELQNYDEHGSPVFLCLSSTHHPVWGGWTFQSTHCLLLHSVLEVCATLAGHWIPTAKHAVILTDLLQRTQRLSIT